MKQDTGSNISTIPHEILIREGDAQKDRLLEEVMSKLFESLPDNANLSPDFVLSGGTRCFIKKFYAPRPDHNGELAYGFDVKFDSGPLSHLEFVVKCSGWERGLMPPA